MFVPESDIQKGFLNLADRYIGQRQNVSMTVAELRRNPDTFTRIAWQFDRIVDDLDCRMRSEFPPYDHEVALMPNVVRTRELLRDRGIPGLVNLYHNHTLRNLKTGLWVFQEANRLMQMGEAGNESNGWIFHKDLDNVEDFASALLLEMYGLYSRRVNPELTARGINPVIALEEVLAYGHIHTDLFIAARRWYTQDEGFSPQMIKYVNAIVTSRLKRTRPPIENPEYRLFEIKDRNALFSKDARAVLLGAQTPDQLITEVKLQGLLGAMKNRAEKVYLVHWEGNKVPRGIIVGGQEVAWTHNGVVHAPGGEMIGTYERIIECGGRYGDDQFMAIFLTPVQVTGNSVHL